MAYTIREAYKKIVISYLEIKTNNQKPSDQSIKKFYINIIRNLNTKKL